MSATIELLAAPRMKDSELAENGVLAHKAAGIGVLALPL